MKKAALVVLSLALITLLASPSLTASQSPAQSRDQIQLRQTTAVPTGQTVRNQNQVQTRNAGEDQELQVTTQERENLGQQRSQERQSEVAKAVQVLLNAADRSGGIGPQIREIARAQNDSQAKAELNLPLVQRQNKIARLVLGPNYQSFKTVKKELGQTEARIRQLQQIQTQLANQGAQQQIKEAIQTLESQKTALQEALEEEESGFSLLWWLIRLF
jgi:hypothetical protein